MPSELPVWSFAYGQPECHARIRSKPEDFRVDEILGFAPDGTGEHLLLQVEKRGANTTWVARQLANIAGVKQRDVSFAGRKDRNAVTVQHFSIWLGRQPEPDWSAHTHPEYKVLSAIRHSRKLRLGALNGNRFRLILRNLSIPAIELESKLQQIRASGVPNYFGTQRFGHGGSNIRRAEEFFADPRSVRDRNMRSLLLSTARSLIFNAMLSERISRGSWNTVLPGEVCMLAGSHSVFRADKVDDVLRERMKSGDIHPTATLWGTGDSLASGEALAFEQEIVKDYILLARGLEAASLKAARRALRLPIPDLQWHLGEDETLVLEFFLPAGSYATAVLRELVMIDNVSTGVENDAEED